MATAAEPRPAQLPLPGGRDGATVKLFPLLVARCKTVPAIFHREGGRLKAVRVLGFGVSKEEMLEVPIVAFLVEHPVAGRILVDTGFHASVAVEPSEGFGRLGGLVFRDLEMDAEQSVPAQLRERGIDPGEVRTVIMTHLHADHASGVSQFPGATFLVSAPEWDAAGHGGLTSGYFARHFDHAFDWRTIDFGSADSVETFGRGIDVFGDGSVRMVFTPGHTAGHCSVILRLGGRDALLTGDAAYTRRTLDESVLPHQTVDEHLFRRSLRELQLYVKGNPDALVIPGHDMERWRELDASYA